MRCVDSYYYGANESKNVISIKMSCQQIPCQNILPRDPLKAGLRTLIGSSLLVALHGPVLVLPLCFHTACSLLIKLSQECQHLLGWTMDKHGTVKAKKNLKFLKGY